MDVHKKSNKENTRPSGQKAVTSFIKRADPGKSVPLRFKNDQKDGAVTKRAGPIKKPEQRAAKSVVSQPTAKVKKMQTLTQTFLSQQSANSKKLLAAAPPQTLPGTYKGKVVQSKVDCFRKPGEVPTTGATEKKVFAKPAVPRAVGPAPAALSRVKSRSVATLPVRTAAAPGISQTQPRRPKSVTDVPLSRPTSKTTRGGQTQTVSTVRQFQVTKRPAATIRSVPPTSSRPATAPVAVKKSNEQMGHNATKPPVATSQRPVCKPVTSTLSHTRVGIETVEERRAKLAEWLAAKGKTLKRPPIHSTQPAQRTRPLVKPKAEPTTEARPAVAEPESLAPGTAVAEPNSEPVADLEMEGGSVTSSPAKVMNTTLDMIDNCELDLPEVDVRLENLVVNLCEALDAMETPSACQQSEGDVGDLGDKQEAMRVEVQVEQKEEEQEDEQDKTEMATDEIKEVSGHQEIEVSSKSREDSAEESEAEEMEADSIEESATSSYSEEDKVAAIAEPEVKREAKTEIKSEDSEEDDEDGNEDDVEVVDGCGPKTPECNGASVVKFSVRTTPYLQSVKKRIDGESTVAAAPSSCGSSRRQPRSGTAAAIGDLKFLTPVRRSRRIERQSARLPAALTEHDPCVTSLAELARLEGAAASNSEVHVGVAMAANAYIYRRNPALLDELPDGHRDLTHL